MKKGRITPYQLQIKETFLIQYPSKRWGFVGHVPVELAFIDATAEQLKNMHFGEQFGPKRRTFETESEARKVALELEIDLKN